MSVTVFSGMNCEFSKSSIIVEIFAILQVLDLKWRLLPRMGGLFGWCFSGVFSSSICS